MNDKHPLVPVEDGVERVDSLMQLPAESGRQTSPFRKAHSVLRGRYKWAITLGLIFAITGGTLGYRLVEPIYRAHGTLRVQPILPKVLYESEQNSLLPMFSAYVGSQVALISSSRVVNKALSHEQWQSVGRERSPETIQQFNDSLSVNHPRNSELILVSFDDTDPSAARKAVHSVIESFIEIFGDTDVQSVNYRLEQLESRRNQLRNELQALVRRQEALAKEFGSKNLEQIYQKKLEQVAEYEQDLKEMEVTIQLAENAVDGAKKAREEAEGEASNQPSPDQPNQGAEQPEAHNSYVALTPVQIAARDPKMSNMLQQKQAAERELKRLSLTLGENHRQVVQARTLLDSIQESIDEYAADFNEQLAQLSGGENMAGPGNRQNMSLDQLKERYDAIKKLHAETRKEAVELGNKNITLSSLQNEEATLRDRLDETELRMEQLKVESAVSGRISIVSRGELPLKPYKDRRQGLAFVGAVFGGSLGFGIVLLIGSLDRRLRSLDDAQDTLAQLTMLGILPRLPDDLAEPEHAAVAAHCVHQIRTLLQIGSDAQGRRVFAITSPGAQDGKTSLSLALGVSFAAAGSKTLLVDCDLIGGGLTLRVDTIIRRKIGQVLQREQLVTQQQVEEALQIAQESNRRLGETLIELGYLSQEDLDEALSLQEQTPVGLLDALEGEPLEECVAATGIKSLDILPVGGAEAYDVCKVSPTFVRRLLEDARSQYDVVLIDTGPVPGSLEASHICAESDGVVMVVARGEQRRQAEKSVNHLYSIGARVLGLVFNRAEGSDVQVLSASLTDALSEAQMVDDDGVEQRTSTRLAISQDESEEARRFDPVARAVASSSNSTRRNGSKSS